jgi:hypothetical protein
VSPITNPEKGTMEKVSNAALARHLDLSRERIRALTKEGVLKRLPDGTFPIDENRRLYIRFLRDRPVRSAQSDELRAARQRLIESKIAREEKALQRDAINEAVAFVQETIARFCNKLDALPRAFSRNAEDQQRLETMINRLRNEESAFAKEKAAG